MRTSILTALITATALAGALPGAANAQSRPDQRTELRHDRQDIRQAQRTVRHDRQDVRKAQQAYREDWRDYRAHNRAVFNRGNWQAPFRYQPFKAGSAIRPAYYAPRYVVSNPARYHLPAAGRDMRWVRHYDDMLLVNVRTGRVVRVYTGFFW